MTPIDITSPALAIRILPRGATLSEVRLRAQGRNLVLGFADPAHHFTIPGYAGALVGPIANRVSGGRVTLAGQTHQMAKNENGITALHSGADGIHAHLWDIDTQRKDHVTLVTTLSDGACGLPGNRTIRAAYSVTGNTLWLEITATTDRPTPMNIAAHPYWCLDGGVDVSRHRLQIDATEYTPTDPQNIPTGQIAATAGSLFDFARAKYVPLDPALDVNFCLARAERRKPVHAATLTGADGTRLDIATTAPGLQVYNGAYLPSNAAILSDAADLNPFKAIALEPQYWPDAPNIAHFPQITLNPGSTWRQTTTYALSQGPVK